MWWPRSDESIRSKWLPLDENEVRLRELREQNPYWSGWTNPWGLETIRHIYGNVPPGKDTTLEEDDRMRQTSPQGRTLNDPDHEFLDGIEGAESYKKQHRL